MEKVAPMTGAHEQAQETAPITQEQMTSAFEAGFNDDEDRPQATETPPAQEPVAQTPPPEYIQIERKDWEALNQRMAKVDQIETTVGKRFDDAFSRLGGFQREITKLQTATPSGAAVQVSDEDFAEFKEQYPELAELTVKGLNKALGKVKGTASNAVDPEALQRSVTEATQAIKAEATDAMLDAIVDGDWKEEVNTPAFGDWLQGQPENVKALANSARMGDAAKLLRTYKARPAATPTPAATPAQPSMRSRQMAAAVTPRGSSGSPAPSGAKSPFQQAFEEDD